MVAQHLGQHEQAQCSTGVLREQPCTTITSDLELSSSRWIGCTPPHTDSNCMFKWKAMVAGPLLGSQRMETESQLLV